MTTIGELYDSNALAKMAQTILPSHRDKVAVNADEDAVYFIVACEDAEELIVAVARTAGPASHVLATSKAAMTRALINKALGV